MLKCPTLQQKNICLQPGTKMVLVYIDVLLKIIKFAVTIMVTGVCFSWALDSLTLVFLWLQ